MRPSKFRLGIIEGYFERENIILHEKNLKHRKIILLINCIFDPTFFLIVHETFFQKKDFPQLHRF